MNMVRKIAVTSGAALGIALACPGAAAPTKPVAKSSAPTKAATKPAHLAKGDVTRAQLLAEVKQVFVRADTNHDGFMSRSEFAVRMGAVLNETPPGSPNAPTPEQAQKMLTAANTAFTDVDKNHDGKLSFAEASFRPLKIFDEMDANHDGVLTLAEKAAAHRQGEQSRIGPVIDGPSADPGR